MSVQQVVYIRYGVLWDIIVLGGQPLRVQLERIHRQQTSRRKAAARGVPRVHHILYRHLYQRQHVEHAPRAITALQGLHQLRVLLERILLLDPLNTQRVYFALLIIIVLGGLIKWSAPLEHIAVQADPLLLNA